MSQSIRFVFCLALILIAPAVAWAGTSTAGCDTAAVAVGLDLVDPMTGLPTTVLDTTSAGFSCPFAFESASFCHQCWAALNQCSGPDCYACTELCLGRLGCWIP